MKPRDLIEQSKRIVIKIGSALLTDEKTGTIKQEWLQSIADDLAAWQKDGKEIVIVSSGAIALGRKSIGIDYTNTPSSIPLELKQAAASVGQIEIVKGFDVAFEKHDIPTALILLNPKDTEERRAHLNARATIHTLLEKKHIPVINENDTVSTAEIRFGDNDRLAARVAQMIGADLLIQLSTIDGLYDSNPETDKNAQHILLVETIDDAIEQMAGEAKPGLSTGGMKSKLKAAKIAMQAGVHMVITDGTKNNALSALMDDARATIFKASEKPLSARKKWISSHVHPEGSLTLDEGAINALKNGKSLLPSGVIKISGDFTFGEAVEISDVEGHILAVGITKYSADEARHIIGKKSSDIAPLLGYSRGDELIHRDDLVLT
ncbi:MAG: glutamate 5-kinase [Pseudomonadota bacterium]